MRTAGIPTTSTSLSTVRQAADADSGTRLIAGRFGCRVGDRQLAARDLDKLGQCAAGAGAARTRAVRRARRRRTEVARRRATREAGAARPAAICQAGRTVHQLARVRGASVTGTRVEPAGPRVREGLRRVAVREAVACDVDARPVAGTGEQDRVAGDPRRREARADRRASSGLNEAAETTTTAVRVGRAGACVASRVAGPRAAARSGAAAGSGATAGSRTATGSRAVTGRIARARAGRTGAARRA